MPRDFDTIYNDAELSSDDDDNNDENDDEDLVTLTTNPSEITYLSPRPILVGYAFGPKKMSTMGIIMAEASQLMNSAVLEDEEVSEMMDDGEMPALEGTNNNNNSNNINNNSNNHNHHHHYHHHPPLLSSLTGRNNNKQRMDESLDGDEPSLPSLVTCSTQTCTSSTSHASSSIMMATTTTTTNNSDQQKRPKLTIDALEEKMRTGMMESAACSSSSSSYCCGCSTNHNGIYHPFRRCHNNNNNTSQQQHQAASSLSSNASQSSSIISGLAPSYIAYKDVVGGSNSSHRLQLQPVRVSFVPLDLDSPLEEQHGGRFDVILHKMTEDILCISTSSSSSSSATPDESSFSPSSKTKESRNNKLYTGAMSRIQRLNRYKLNHPSCCLVDHPDNIKALMSRSDIARILSTSLINVTTASGIPVRTPRYFVCPDNNNNTSHLKMMQQKMNGIGDKSSSFTYPIIAKPLTAAGTVKSHRMMVVLGRKGLSRIPTPCLVQEYANHDGVLYKVYVLGDTVWVFSRSSLPNLPMGDANDDDEEEEQEQEQEQEQCCPRRRRKEMITTSTTRCFVEFDSQRPYPKLSDFGVRISPPTTTSSSAAAVVESVARASLSSITAPRNDKVGDGDDGEDDESSSHGGKRTREGVTSSQMTAITTPTTITTPSSSTVVTADEIRPVVSILSKAFGLELFGFDILVTNGRQNGQQQKEMLVVDVNYFPSYKEVMNFPSLLAQYLTKRAVNGMRQTTGGGGTTTAEEEEEVVGEGGVVGQQER